MTLRADDRVSVSFTAPERFYLVGAAQAPGDALRFERNLLREWLRRELPAPQ